MTIPEEIEQLKTKLAQTSDERGQAEVLMKILHMSSEIRSAGALPYIDILLKLADKLNEPAYTGWATLRLAEINRFQSKYDTSIELSRAAILIFGQLQDKKGIASASNNIGVVYKNKGNYAEALKYNFEALRIGEETGNKTGIATSYGNIGMVYELQGRYPEALANYINALKLQSETCDKNGLAYSYNNIGSIHMKQSNFVEALRSFSESAKLGAEAGNNYLMSSAYNNIGILYEGQGDYNESLTNHFASLRLSEGLSNKIGIASSYNNIGTLYERLGRYGEALQNHRVSLKIKEELGDRAWIATSYINIGIIYQRQGEYAAALDHLHTSLKLSEETGFKELTRTTLLNLFETYQALSDHENALKYHIRYHEAEKQMLGEESQKQLNHLSFMHNLEQKEKQLEIEHLRNVELKRERDRSESLLLNILPAEVAEELKEKGTAGARLFDDVTVLFTDFKSFTMVSERLSPQELVDELHACFSAFDEIMGRYGIEKIKTVGDAYLAVSGLPQAHESHAENMLRAAIEIRDFMTARQKDVAAKVSQPRRGDLEEAGGPAVRSETFEIRIGVHSGSVVAGIVGVKKFAYDIWGDTVNTAARMEQNSEAGHINISQTTYELVKDIFTCQYRGEIEAKNKGKLKMYFVN